MMKAVVLDGFAFSGGDIDLSELKALCDITYYDRTADCDAAKRIGGAQIVFTNKVVIGRQVIDSCPEIKYIGVLATGYNLIDLEYTRQKGICVTNIPAYSTDAVAQQVFAYILHYYSKIDRQNRSVHCGDWERNPDFCYFPADAFELSGKTLGILGYGNIGRRVAQIGAAFGMRVIAHSASAKPENADGAELVSFESLLKQSDILSLHCALTPNTERIINSRALALMKVSAMLINTSRGGVIDESAVAAALNAGRLACAAVDVLQSEPPANGSPLLTAKNCVITPHTAWAPRQTRQRCVDSAAANLKAFLAGKPINRVN